MITNQKLKIEKAANDCHEFFRLLAITSIVSGMIWIMCRVRVPLIKLTHSRDTMIPSWQKTLVFILAFDP